jgi:hypothetical protein
MVLVFQDFDGFSRMYVNRITSNDSRVTIHFRDAIIDGEKTAGADNVVTHAIVARIYYGNQTPPERVTLHYGEIRANATESGNSFAKSPYNRSS